MKSFPALVLMNAILTRIERIETESLVWGYTDGSLSREETLALCADVCLKSGYSRNPESLLEEMIGGSILFEFVDFNGSERIRSRFAEGARLLCRLRQLFPKKAWQTAPRLVSDFRVDIRPRRFPKRVIEPDEGLKHIESLVDLKPIDRKLWESLLEPAQKKLKLSSFQVESTTTVLAGIGTESGTIVTAGTGSGKTLCFYIPALIRIGREVEKNSHWTKALAIYPRTELLKDQLAEAYQLVRRIDEELESVGKRPIIISALFQSTPTTCSEASLRQAKWPERRDGFVCPFISCPFCEKELVWLKSDVNSRTERLTCTGRGSCDQVITEQTFIITRESLRKRAPDILFTTVEMLNRRMSDTQLRRLFGLGMPFGQRPFLLLLDEAHTYTGTTGAHSALVIRRWKNAVRSQVFFTGLSATLMDARNFFSVLTGLPADNIVEISPRPEDMEIEGAEYNLVLLGDPSSQTSLLSTSIQTGMLMGRLMDKSGKLASGGIFGSRVFMFTDDLDVTNRLFDDLKDAEGYDIFGRPKSDLPLASLREQPAADEILFNLDGQRWKLCEDIGRNLKERLKVSRTTSQDTGVAAGKDIIVATSALELGFDDPEVGAVVQHKAPRSMAAFVQRKGRAGRSRSMRPFMVTVLSDYGRDRIAYQSYEQFFDPVLPAQQLPVRNHYILKMQAVFSLIDWISGKWATYNGGKVAQGWFLHTLAGPFKDGDPGGIEQRQRFTRNLLGELLKGGDQRLLSEFKEHLSRSLGIDGEDLASVLWDAPRSLMLEAIPTLARRLATNWKLCCPMPGGPENEYHVTFPPLPLPEFLPESLFNELSLPEVQIMVPAATVRDEPHSELLPLLKAIQQFSPGRVSRRFAPERGKLSHWIPVDDTEAIMQLPLSKYAVHYEYVGDFPSPDSGATIPVYRPYRMQLYKVPPGISPVSNSFLDWSSDFQFSGDPVRIDPPIRTKWSEIVNSVQLYLHTFRCAVGVRRYSLSARANVRRMGAENNVTVYFTTDEGSRAAIGFEQEVDGLVLKYKLPDGRNLIEKSFSDGLKARCRTSFFRHLVRTDKALPDYLNGFLREWLLQIYLSELLAESSENGTSIPASIDRMRRSDLMPSLTKVMNSIFSIQEVQAAVLEEEKPEDEPQEPESSHSTGPPRVGRLQQNLLNAFSTYGVLERLHELASSLWLEDPDGFDDWIRGKVHETLGQSVLFACMQRAPEHAMFDTLLVDARGIGTNADDELAIYVTEGTLGGAGVLEKLAEVFAEEPRSFFSAIEASLAASDFELAFADVEKFLAVVCENNKIARIALEVQHTQGHRERETKLRELFSALASNGIHVGHVTSVVLNARILRPGMNLESWRMIADLLRFWDELEQHYGMAIEHRIFCYVAAVHPRFADAIRKNLSIRKNAGTPDIVSTLSGILWPRPSEIRQRRLESMNPFRPAQMTDPQLVRELLLETGIATVAFHDEQWFEKTVDALTKHGVCRLQSDSSRVAELRSAVVKMAATPVDMDFLQFFPAVERFEKENDLFLITFVLREAI